MTKLVISFVRVAGMLVKGHMRPTGRRFDMPGHKCMCHVILKFISYVQICVGCYLLYAETSAVCYVIVC